MSGETPEQRQQKLDELKKAMQQGACPDFGAQVSGQLASARGIDRAKESERMRVPSFEEREAERARLADHFRKNGVL